MEKVMALLKGKHLVVSGPVIIHNNKLLAIKDKKDKFYKLPGGSIEKNEQTLEEACHREVKEEINGKIKIIKPLTPKILWQNPTTKEEMTIVLTSFLAKLENMEEIKPQEETIEIKWLDLKKIKEWKHLVSPYI